MPVNLNTDDLTTGVVAGALGLAPALLPAGPGAASPVALAAGVALLLRDLAPLVLVGGLVVLALPTLLLPAGPTRSVEAVGLRPRRRAAMTVGAVLLGTGLVVAGLPSDVGSPARTLAGLVLLVVSAGLARPRAPIVPPPWQTLLVALAAAGVVLAVPDTESALTVFGAGAVAAAAGLLPHLRDRHPAALAPLVGLVVWAVVDGSAAREAAVIGGLACLGVLLADPAARLLLAFTQRDRIAPPTTLLVSTQILVAGFASRVITRQSGAPEALLLTGIVLVVSTAVLAFARSRPPRTAAAA